MTTRATIVAIALVVALVGAGTVPAAHAAEHTLRSTHFALTWSDVPSDPDAPDLTDGDHDGVPDSVVRMVAAFEAARAFLLDDLGYRPPPTRGRYNLYVSSAIDRGVTRPAPGGNGRSKPSFVTIPRYLMRRSATDGQVRSFAAHEYFHAIQLGYDAGEDRWILEASSSWVEALFAPEADHNLAYLYDFVPRLELGLASETGIHSYGAFLFLQFLAERYGGGSVTGAGIVRELWEAMAVPEAMDGAPDDGSMEALERVLNARGATLSEAWSEFVLWAWQLDRFEHGAVYRRALRDQRWPSAPPTPVTEETCRLIANAPDDVLPPFSADFVRFKLDSPNKQRARLTVRGPAGGSAYAIVRHPGETWTVTTVPFDDAGIGALDVEIGGRPAARVILAVANDARVPGTFEYSMRVHGAGSVTTDAPSAPASTIYGTGITASGRVYCNGAPAPFAHVVVTRTEAGNGAVETFALTTDVFGGWALTTVPAATSTYSVDVVDALLSPATSAPSTVGVRVAVNMAVADDQVGEGEPITVEGNVAPVHRGVVVLERRRPNGVYETAAETVVGADGRYRFDYVFPTAGVWEVRAVMRDTGDTDHLPGDSAPKLVEVGES